MKKNKFIAILFLGGLFLITLSSLAKPDDVFSVKEKRYLAQKPDFSADTLFSGKYGRDYEIYLNDQFPLREPLAALHTDCERLLGKTEISGIYFGKSDYFIEHHKKKEYHTSLADKNQTAVLEFLHNVSGQLGSDRVRFLAVPSAETILTKYLPNSAPSSAESDVLEKYQQQLNKTGNGQVFVPLQNDLETSQKEYQIYYRTDHHWTMDGAFLGYRAWADSMGISSRSKDDFSETILKNDFYGTVSARVNTEIQPDSLSAFLPLFDVNYEVYYPDAKTPANSLYAKEMLDGPEPYAVYLKGNQPFTRIHTEGISQEMSDRKLLVIKDSFGNSLVPFLVNHYPETTVIDLRYYNQSLSELICKEQITDICVVMNPAQMAKEKSLYKIKH